MPSTENADGNIWLADGLTAGDGQRRIVIGAILEMTAHEFATVDPLHRLKHAGIRHPALTQLEQKAHLAFGATRIVICGIVAHPR